MSDGLCPDCRHRYGNHGRLSRRCACCDPSIRERIEAKRYMPLVVPVPREEA